MVFFKNTMCWPQSTMNSLDLTDFHINKLRTIKDLNIYMLWRIERRNSNFLSTLYTQCLQTGRNGAWANSLIILMVVWFKIRVLSTRFTDFGLNVEPPFRTDSPAGLGWFLSEQGKQVRTKVPSFSSLSNYLNIMSNNQNSQVLDEQADQVRMLTDRTGCSYEQPNRSDMSADRPGLPIG